MKLIVPAEKMVENRKILFLDRDGVINVDTGYTHLVEELSFVDGIFELCQAAVEKEYLLIVITNQSGIARGLYTEAQMDLFHQHVITHFTKRNLHFSHIYYCPHHPSFTGKCLCRKPENLLFQKALAKFNANPIHSWMIGDNERDIIAGKKSGCKTILLGEQNGTQADFQIKTLQEAIELI
ncbi:MAG: HAD family hydrolase [Bacteroidota bacterium]